MARQEQDNDLVAPLYLVRRRLVVRASVYLVLGVAVAGFVGYLAGALLPLIGVAAPVPPVVIALIAAAMTLVVGATVLMRSRRSIRRLAFDIDGIEELHQRYGTAVEIAGGDDARKNPVSRALLISAGGDARRLDPRRLVPMATRPMAALLVLVGVMAGGTLFAMQNQGLFVVMNGTAEGAQIEDSESRFDDMIETARSAAELISEDAEDGNNRYLANVAKELRDRIAQAEDGEGEDLDRLQEELEELFRHAALAYGQDVPEWMGGPESERMAGMDDRIAEHELRQAAAEREPASVGPGQEYGVGPQVDRSDRTGASEDALEIFDLIPPDDRDREFIAGGANGMADEVRPMSSDDFMEDATRVGPAMEAGRGLSDEAGIGAETLEEDAAFADIARTLGDEMVLTGESDREGRRIRVEVSPEGRGEVIDGEVVAGAAMAGAAGGRGTQLRDFIPSHRLDVTARYFARASQ